MKKILLISVVFVTLFSCTKNDLLEDFSSIDIIKYKSYSTQITKSESNDSADELKNTGFVVNATFSNKDILYIDNDLVTYNGIWNSVGTQKEWPSNSNLSFLAMGNNESVYNLEIAKNPSFGYSISNNVNSQKDLLIAYSPNLAKGDNSTANLKFRNALAKISVMVKAETNDPTLSLEITQIEIQGVSTEGKCIVSSTLNNTAPFDWTLNNERSNISLGLNTESATIKGGTSTYNDILSSNGHAMVIPQKMTSIIIKGVWKQNIDGYSTIVEDFTTDATSKTIHLEENKEEWLADSNYVYKLNLTPNVTAISFDATVLGWQK